MITLRRESAWQFKTSGGGGGGMGPILVSAGMFVLQSPEGQLQRFDYGGAGLGLSAPLPKLLRLPHLTLPKITLRGQELGLTGATADFPSDGIVYVTQACHGADLEPKQLEGGALYFDSGAGWLRGFAGTILIAGITPELLEIGVMIPRVMALAISGAPAVIFMKGQNAGLQESLGVDAMFGAVTWRGEYQP